MRGQILGVDARTGEGMVAGEDGNRYAFRQEDWAHRGEPAIGIQVDFETRANRALSVFPVPVAAAAGLPAIPAAAPARGRSDRNKWIAALLAFALGPIGVHRFYLGRNTSALVMLVLSVTVVGLVLSVPWALIDMIRYIAMSDEEFAARYHRD